MQWCIGYESTSLPARPWPKGGSISGCECPELLRCATSSMRWAIASNSEAAAAVSCGTEFSRGNSSCAAVLRCLSVSSDCCCCWLFDVDVTSSLVHGLQQTFESLSHICMPRLCLTSETSSNGTDKSSSMTKETDGDPRI